MPGRLHFLLGALVLTCCSATAAMADMSMEDHASRQAAAMAGAKPGSDQRQLLDFPPAFRRQELANMRSHMEAVQAITRYLAEHKFQAAADVATARLTRAGMSAHDRHQSMQYMPGAMLAMGMAMHRSAGHFATVAQDAAVTGNMTAALGALADVESHCVACHRTYRMR